MYILVSDDLSRATVKLTEVSVKHYQFFEDIVNELFKLFKENSPQKVEFGAHNKITEDFNELVNTYGYSITSDGEVLSLTADKKCYNLIEKEVDDMIPTFELEFESKYRFEEVCKLLLLEGYTISADTETNKYKIQIH